MDYSKNTYQYDPSPAGAPPVYYQTNIPPQPSSSLIPRQFPPAFNLYHVSGFGSSKYTIGEHQNQPLYMCSWHGALSSSPPIVLHCGPDESFPPLATADTRAFSRTFYIDLPPVNPAAGTGFAREEVQSTGSRVLRFSIEVGPNNIREQFEWRHSSGDAVKHLNGRSSGWKLVRLTNGPPGGGFANAATFVPGGYRTSDGHEVVAAWTTNKGSKVGKFHFTGSGLSGVLGERWAIMAVVTFCAMLQRIRKQAAAASAGAGS